MTENKYAPAVELCCCGECEAKGHVKKVIRDLTPEEIADKEAMAAAWEAEVAAREAENARIANLKAEARAALIAGKPLTPEQAEVITL